MDLEIMERAAAFCKDFFRRLGEAISEAMEKIGEMLKEIRDFILKVENIPKYKLENKPKYKFIKSLIKPYKQPIIKIKTKARANL